MFAVLGTASRKLRDVFAAAALLLAALTVPAAAERSVLLVLDASGSMVERLPDGRTRFAAAQAAVGDMLGALGTDTRIGLRVYGHQSKASEKNCQDTALVTGFAAADANRQPMLAQVKTLEPRGYTPITLSLEQAAVDFASEGEAERVIVLLSDGRETCKGDPCAAAKALAAADVRLVVHTIGLGVDAAARSQLKCIASVARGTYSDARTGRELSERLATAASTPKAPPPAPKPQAPATGSLRVKGILEAGVPVLDAKGEIVGPVGSVQPQLDLPPGIYSVRFTNGDWTGIEIKAGEITEIEPAYLKIETPAKDNLSLVDNETDEEVGFFFMAASPTVAVLPGRFSARSSLPFSWTGIELTPSKVTVIRPALVRLNAPAGSTKFYTVVQLSTGIEGTTTSESELSLPAGAYRLSDPDDPALSVEFTVGEAETKTVTIPR